MDKPKCWVKNVIKKITVESESRSWLKKFVGLYINIWVCPYLTQIWAKTTKL